MAVTQYIGARYVPLFADPIDWDSTKTYEPLTVVYNKGNSYTSRQYVPAGIDISNDTYWARTGNYNAQIEQYRSEVATFDDRITTNETNITDLQNATVGTEKLDDSAVTTAKIKNANVTTDKLADNAVTTAKILDANVTTDKLADNAVTTAKIADGSITPIKLATNLHDMVVVGDSLSDISNEVPAARLPNWSQVLSNELNLTLHNYAVSGTTFAGGGPADIPAQMQNAINDSRFNNDNVKYVFIEGGINDISTNMNGGNVYNSVFNTIQMAVNAFKNAEIYIIPLMVGVAPAGLWSTNWNQFNIVLTNIFYAASLTKAHCIKYAWEWLSGLFDKYNANGDTAHPNAEGFKIIAKMVYDGINGIENRAYRPLEAVHYSLATNFNGVLWDFYANVIVNNGIAYFNAQAQLKGNDLPTNQYVYFEPERYNTDNPDTTYPLPIYAACNKSVNDYDARFNSGGFAMYIKQAKRGITNGITKNNTIFALYGHTGAIANGLHNWSYTVPIGTAPGNNF